MEDKIKIVVSRTRGYDIVESRETVITFPGTPDEDLLRQTFREAERALLVLRDEMDDAGVSMEGQMELRAPVEAGLLGEGE